MHSTDTENLFGNIKQVNSETQSPDAVEPSQGSFQQQ